ncbi:MAG: PD-(D/E)XK nuclease family protein [Fimbriimonadales bacterium]|nr:PD-(D/E)XK nuclease family protein [Fimbriimonadales bacterium]
MRLFLGAPHWELIEASRRALGDNCRLLLPPGAARLVGKADHEVYDWHGFLRALTGVALLTQPAPEMVALLGELCEQTLSPQNYFGKVRHSPRFHSALAQNLCRWSLDGLTPELLEQGAEAVLSLPAALTALDDEALQEEWRRKTTELVHLWQAWRRALEQAGLPEPIRVRRALLDALHTTGDAPPILLAGFTELTALDLEALRILDSRTPVAMALLYDPARAEKYVPTDRIRQLLTQWGIDTRSTDSPVCAPTTLGQDCPSHVHALGQDVQATILDTPNLFYEVETVAREILKLHAGGVAFREMALVIRQPETILETLEAIFTRYAIPLQGEVSLPLERSWRVRWLMDGLRLLAGIGYGEDWLHWLEHPAHKVDVLALRRLRRQLRRHIPAAQWLERALQRAIDADLLRLLQELDALGQRLAVEFPQTARRLILKLGDVSERDADLSEWIRLVDAYARAWRQRTPAQSVELLERLVGGARFTHRLGSDGVRLLPMEHADLTGARIVFALQILEGTLPRRHPDDPFLRESERRALNQVLQGHGIHLPTRADYQAAEPMLFQRVLQTAQERLYLSYSRIQSGDSDALPSLYLEEFKTEYGDAVATRFFSLEQIAPEPDDCLHPYDASLAHPVVYIEPAPSLHRAALREQVGKRSGPFSVTELETLVRCPFEHFARYVLRLRPLKRDLGAQDVGTVAHNALCRAVRQSPCRRSEEWVEALAEQLRAILSEHAPDLPEWQVQVLHALAQRLLRRFGVREPRYQAQFDLSPFACEWAFGGTEADDEERTLTEPLHNRRRPQAVSYRLSDGQQIPLRGVIDRIDLSPDRRVAMVLDYKLGSAPSRNDFTEGRAVQGLLYLHAVKTVLPNAHVVLAYDRLKAAQRVRFVPNLTELTRRFKRLEDEDSQQFQVLSVGQWRQAEQRLRETLTEAIRGLRAAAIEPKPGDHCRRCAFADLCRTAWR